MDPRFLWCFGLSYAFTRFILTRYSDYPNKTGDTVEIEDFNSKPRRKREILKRWRKELSKPRRKREILKRCGKELLNQLQNNLQPRDLLISFTFATLAYSMPSLLAALSIDRSISRLDAKIFSEELKKLMKKSPTLFFKLDDTLQVHLEKLATNNLTSVEKQNAANELADTIKVQIKLDLARKNFKSLVPHVMALLTLLFWSSDISYNQYVKFLLMFLIGRGLPSWIKKLIKELIRKYGIEFPIDFLDFIPDLDD